LPLTIVVLEPQLSLIDLAGSERGADTTNTGVPSFL
jgi:hypothetical protein